MFRANTQDQLAGFILPTWQALVDGARYVDERLTEIFEELEPDAIVEDNVCSFPAIPASGRPWVRIVSCNPLEVKDPGCRPRSRAWPLEDRTNWEAFRAEYAAQVGDLQASFSDFCVQRGAPPLPAMEMIHESPWLNLYLYPQELDYPRGVALGRTWHNLQTCVRSTDEPWTPPEGVVGTGSTGSSISASARWALPTWSSCGGSSSCWPTRRTATSSAAARATTSTSWPTT